MGFLKNTIGGMSILSIINIAIFVVGLMLVVIAFLTYTRRGESEISQDVLMTPKFIAGLVMIVASIILGFIF